jgi:hypothetical protein
MVNGQAAENRKSNMGTCPKSVPIFGMWALSSEWAASGDTSLFPNNLTMP